MGLAQLWMKTFNYLLMLQALVIIGGAGYIASQKMTSFCYILFSCGGYVLLVGFIGVLMNGRRSPKLVTLYAVTFFALILLHAALVVGFVFFEDKTVEILQELNSSSEDTENVRRYIKDHAQAFKIGAIVVLSVELITFAMATCCVRAVAGPERSGLEGLAGSDSTVQQMGLLGAEVRYGEAESATPHTDARRAALNEKYAGAFAKQQQQDYMRL